MPRSALRIILQRRGCTNRPFYHIAAQTKNKLVSEDAIEQIGSYDPMPNLKGEKLVAINFERLNYYLSLGAQVQTPAGIILGLCGYFPIHPRTYMQGYRNREAAKETGLDKSKEAEG